MVKKHLSAEEAEIQMKKAFEQAFRSVFAQQAVTAAPARDAVDTSAILRSNVDASASVEAASDFSDDGIILTPPTSSCSGFENDDPTAQTAARVDLQSSEADTSKAYELARKIASIEEQLESIKRENRSHSDAATNAKINDLAEKKWKTDDGVRMMEARGAQTLVKTEDGDGKKKRVNDEIKMLENANMKVEEYLKERIDGEETSSKGDGSLETKVVAKTKTKSKGNKTNKEAQRELDPDDAAGKVGKLVEPKGVVEIGGRIHLRGFGFVCLINIVHTISPSPILTYTIGIVAGSLLWRGSALQEFVNLKAEEKDQKRIEKAIADAGDELAGAIIAGIILWCSHWLLGKLW